MARSGQTAPNNGDLAMKVLVACEYSGIVRDAFIALGHDAMSCDLLPTEQPGPHYMGDVFDVIDYPWDLMIAHPPCTHLSVSGRGTLQSSGWMAGSRRQYRFSCG